MHACMHPCILAMHHYILRLTDCLIVIGWIPPSSGWWLGWWRGSGIVSGVSHQSLAGVAVCSSSVTMSLITIPLLLQEEAEEEEEEEC